MRSDATRLWQALPMVLPESSIALADDSILLEINNLTPNNPDSVTCNIFTQSK
jgi:hypothetical protein